MDLVRMHRDDPPPSVTGLRPDAPAALESIAAAALAKDPAERPADGGVLYAALRGDETAATMIAAPAALAGEGATQIISPPAAAAAAPARRRTLVTIAV